MHLKDGLLGPILFVLAATLTAVGFFAPRGAVQGQSELEHAVTAH